MPLSISFSFDHLRVWRSKLSGRSRSAASIRRSSPSTASAPTFSAAFANALTWSTVRCPAANRSRTFGISWSRRATLAIFFDSRCGSRASCRSTSPASTPDPPSPVSMWWATSHKSEETIDRISPNIWAARVACSRDIGPTRAWRNSPTAAPIRSIASPPHPPPGVRLLGPGRPLRVPPSREGMCS